GSQHFDIWALLRSDSRRSTSQNVFLNFAGCSFGKLLEKGHAMRRFEMREVGPCKLAQLFLIRALALLEHNKSVWRLAPATMRQPDDRNLLYRRMSQKHALDFDGGNVLAAADDDVFQAVANLDVAIRMHDRSIPRMKPSAANRLFGCFRVVVVTGHDHIAAGHNSPLGNPVSWPLLSFFVPHA